MQGSFCFLYLTWRWQLVTIVVTMSERLNNQPERELVGLKEFLEKKHQNLMEEIANSSALPIGSLDIAPKPRAPFGLFSFDAKKNKKSPLKIRTGVDEKYNEIFQKIEDLAQDYFNAAQKALGFGKIHEARDFIDEGMFLLNQFEQKVPDEFITLNAEILTKFPVD